VIHPTADVSPQAQIGVGTRIWHHAQIREGAVIGGQCIIGKNVYIDFGVRIGDKVKVQNNALLYHGLTVEDGVFIGPQACLTNDRFPRAITPDGDLKGADDWIVGPTLIRYGASIGASATVLAGLTIGRFAMVGAGAVVTRSVPDYGLVVGVPARLVGYVCKCGRPLERMEDSWRCQDCGWEFRPPAKEPEGQWSISTPHRVKGSEA
jgi:UDP-2-acetamido-3-amino-2,3-dideoxy-glucuronate N-acetyltransferase